MRIEIAYATAAEQVVLTTELPPGATVEEAIRASGILERFAEIDIAQAAVGIYGERAALTDTLQEGDRVEIYRPLLADPKEARRRRAGKQQSRRR